MNKLLTCFVFFHKWKCIFDSETQKHKMRKNGIPLRASIAGYSRHQCVKCNSEKIERWRAF